MASPAVEHLLKNDKDLNNAFPKTGDYPKILNNIKELLKGNPLPVPPPVPLTSREAFLKDEEDHLLRDIVEAGRSVPKSTRMETPFEAERKRGKGAAPQPVPIDDVQAVLDEAQKIIAARLVKKEIDVVFKNGFPRKSLFHKEMIGASREGQDAKIQTQIETILGLDTAEGRASAKIDKINGLIGTLNYHKSRAATGHSPLNPAHVQAALDELSKLRAEQDILSMLLKQKDGEVYGDMGKRWGVLQGRPGYQKGERLAGLYLQTGLRKFRTPGAPKFRGTPDELSAVQELTIALLRSTNRFWSGKLGMIAGGIIQRTRNLLPLILGGVILHQGYYEVRYQQGLEARPPFLHRITVGSPPDTSGFGTRLEKSPAARSLQQKIQDETNRIVAEQKQAAEESRHAATDRGKSPAGGISISKLEITSPALTNLELFKNDGKAFSQAFSPTRLAAAEGYNVETGRKTALELLKRRQDHLTRTGTVASTAGRPLAPFLEKLTAAEQDIIDNDGRLLSPSGRMADLLKTLAAEREALGTRLADAYISGDYNNSFLQGIVKGAFRSLADINRARLEDRLKQMAEAGNITQAHTIRQGVVQTILGERGKLMADISQRIEPTDQSRLRQDIQAALSSGNLQTARTLIGRAYVTPGASDTFMSDMVVQYTLALQSRRPTFVPDKAEPKTHKR
jgi:hypothetical protein